MAGERKEANTFLTRIVRPFVGVLERVREIFRYRERTRREASERSIEQFRQNIEDISAYVSGRSNKPPRLH